VTDGLVFIGQFMAASVAFFLLAVFVMAGVGQFEKEPVSIRQAASRILGTHLGRLRFLLAAAALSLVLMALFPGPSLISRDTLEPLRKAWLFFLYGKSAEYQPLPAETGTWFWGAAAILYLATFAVYLVLALPDVVMAAITAAKGAGAAGPGAGSSQAPGRLAWDVTAAFLGALAAQLLLRRRESK
jgi:hypothetical protein